MVSNSVADIYQELKRGYYGSNKHAFDSEHYFFRWYRPISFFPTAVLIKYDVSANVVTVVGVIALLTSFSLLAKGQLMIGALLYLTAYLIDFMDGNIARFKGQTTLFGKMIDGLVDSLTFMLFIALAYGNVRHGNALFGESFELFIGVAAAFGFLFRAYFYLRLAFILSQVPQSSTENQIVASAGQVVIDSNTTIVLRPFILAFGKKVYFGLISGMPVLLLIAVLLQGVSVFLLLYIALFVLATLFEVAYGLLRVQRKYM